MDHPPKMMYAWHIVSAQNDSCCDDFLCPDWVPICIHPSENAAGQTLANYVASRSALVLCLRLTGDAGCFPHHLPDSQPSHRHLLSSNAAWSLSEYLRIRTVEFWRKPWGTLGTAPPSLCLPPQLSLCLSLSLSLSSPSVCLFLSLLKPLETLARISSSLPEERQAFECPILTPNITIT